MLVRHQDIDLSAAGTIRLRQRSRRRLRMLVWGLALLLLLPFVIVQPPLPLSIALEGTWKASRDGVDYEIGFFEGGACAFHIEDPDPARTRLFYGSYTLHLNKQPVALSIHDVPGLGHPLHTIVRLSDADQLEMAPFSTIWRLRPTSFDSGKSLLFSREI